MRSSSALAGACRLLVLLSIATPAGANFVPLGSVDTDATAHRACIRGTFAYVAGSEDVTIVDVADPTRPAVVGSFAADAIAGSAYTGCSISDDALLVMTSPIGGTRILRYTLANPTAPQAAGEIALQQYVGAGLDLRGTTAVLTTNLVRWFGGSNDIFEQDGNAIAVDLSRFDAPRSSALFGGVLGGKTNLWRPVVVDDRTALVAGSTASGTDTATGVGRVLVVDVSDPAHVSIVRELSLPGSVHAVSIAVDGSLALVAGNSDGWMDENRDHPCCAFGGALTLSTLDVTDPRDPQLISTEVTAIADAGGLVTAVGGHRFAAITFRSAAPARLIDVDASDPTDLRIRDQEAPGSGDLTVADDRLYLASAAGLAIYDIPALPPEPTPTSTTPSGTATATAPPACAGDCDGDGAVVVAELIRGVNIVLGNVAPAECPAFDRNGDGEVTISELIAAVGALLNGCS